MSEIVAQVTEPVRVPRPPIELKVKIAGSDSEVVGAYWDVNQFGPLSEENANLTIRIPGDSTMFRILNSKYDRVSVEPIYQFNGLHDELFICRRKVMK